MNAIPQLPSPRRTVLPPWTWEELEEILLELAVSPVQQAMVIHLVGGLKTHAHLLTPAGLLREIAVITMALSDPSFPLGGDSMT